MWRAAAEYCLATGCPHPDAIFDRLRWDQWLDWFAFWEVNPWGQDRRDDRLAVSFWATLRPWLTDYDGEAPSPYFPYEVKEAEIDADEVIAYTAAMRELARLWPQKPSANLPSS